jgi:dTDP-4-dehydrorhamnose reductase
MRLLLLGGSGQVGTDFGTLARARGVDLWAPHRSELDLENGSSIEAGLARSKWDAVINASAYTQVDAAEHDKAGAFAINAVAVRHLAKCSADLRIPLIHLSTDYVFGGTKGTPYTEVDTPDPINVYGRSKLLGEQYLRQTNPRHIILRTSWIYSPRGKNFVKTMLQLARTRTLIEVVQDQRGCPTASHDIAEVMIELAFMSVMRPEDTPYGLYHCAGAADATWYDLAKTIMEIAAPILENVPVIKPIQSSEYPTNASRPADSRLDCTLLASTFGKTVPGWPSQFPGIIRKLLSSEE